MRLTKEQSKKKVNNKGITLVSLVITIAVMLILATSTVYISLDRFEINRYNKMVNDIELLIEKVSNYYLKYRGLPIMRNEGNEKIKYSYTSLEFEEMGEYYILDLSAMDNISLNYGKEGYNNPNSSDDVYVINDISNKIYYVQGIEFNDIIYHTVSDENNTTSDNIPPSKPDIKIISGTKNDEGIYITGVKLEIVPGKDNWSGVKETNCSITKNGIEMTETQIEALKQNDLYIISESGTYDITATTQDNSENVSRTDTTIVIEIPENIY